MIVALGLVCFVRGHFPSEYIGTCVSYISYTAQASVASFLLIYLYILPILGLQNLKVNKKYIYTFGAVSIASKESKR
jgi:hypothetical protein